MTPIRPSSAPSLSSTEAPASSDPAAAPAPDPSAGRSSRTSDPIWRFRAAPTLQLRSEPTNPIRSLRDIRTLGDVRDAIVHDFIADRLSNAGRGAQVVQQLGSFPGFLQPNTPVGFWNHDQKPDFNVVGDADTILRRLAGYQGWNHETLERNLALSRRGMVYYNLTLETTQGPVPFKMGILDTSLWREGTFYYDMRASLLPSEGTYVHLNEPGNPHYRAQGEQGEPQLRPDQVSRAEFESHLLKSQAALIGRSLDMMTQPSFTGEDLIQRRFRDQFRSYEKYRIFDWFKGPRQVQRFRRDGVVVENIIAPGLVEHLSRRPNVLAIYDGEHRLDGPHQITAGNLARLRFEWQNTAAERAAASRARGAEFWNLNSELWAQTRLNIASNGTSRRSPHRISWVTYGARKFGRFFGLEGADHSRTYSQHASLFETVDQRLGRTENPIHQMLILAGYNPGDESRPEVFQDIADYAEAEIGKGAQPNLLIKGNSPSKFTMPVRGVPVIAYRFMDALRSPAVRDVVVVGTPDVGVVLNAFQNHFAEEIASRGKRFIFVDTGPSGGGFATNIQAGLDALPNHGEIAILSYGDTPRVDIHNIAYHPWRHSMDYIFGANGRDMVLDFMGMNAHYQGNMDGVGYPLKEGNVQALRILPPGLFQEMFDNRKSVRTGPGQKAAIFLRYLLSRPYHPNILNVPHMIVDAVANSVENLALRANGARPPWVAASVDLAEQAMDTRLRWAADFRPTHLDMGGLVDVDGIRDYVVAEALAFQHNHPHWEELHRFAQEALQPRSGELPALDGTPQRINALYMRVRETLLQREAERPTEEKLGITDETLRRMGFDPDVLPFREDGALNQEWLNRTVPPAEIERYRRAFAAYDNRVNHAVELQTEFFRRFQQSQPYDADLRVPSKIQNFVRRELNVDPERYRGLILEWDYSRLEEAVVRRAQARFGEFGPEVEQVRTYFRQSTTDNLDTPLRRQLHGFKAVDVLRRYQSFLSPSEFQRIYPTLVETLHNARETLGGNRYAQPWNGGLVKDGRFFLRGFFEQAQTTADEIYVRRVGESPPEYRNRGLVASRFPHSNDRAPIVEDSRGDVRRVDSPVYFQQDVNLLARRLRIMPSRVPHLVAAASMASNGGTLLGISSERMSFDRLLAWTQSSEGQAHLRNNPNRYADNLRNRFIEGGPGLTVGVAGMLGAEYLATEIGLDQRTRPHERFMFVTGASHLLNQGTSAVSEVLINRSLGTSFNYVTTRTVQAGGGLALQYGFEARPGLGRALTASLGRSFALEGSGARMAFNGVRGLAAMPFRAAWGMGPGLMSSAIVDRTIGQAFEEGSTARHVVRMGSFFLPDVYRIALGNRGPAIFSSRGMRVASRAFAAGFIADMMFAGANRLYHGGEGSARMSMIYQRANQLHDADESFLRRPIDGVFEMVAPQIASWWDSVELTGSGFVPNRHRIQAEGEIRAFSLHTSQATDETLRHSLLFGGQGEELTPEFYSRVDWSSLRGESRLPEVRRIEGRELPVALIAEHLADPAVRRRLGGEGRDASDPVAYIQNQFRGYDLSRSEVEHALSEIRLHTVRRDLASLNQMQLPENAELGRIFDEHGSLRAGQEHALLGRVFQSSEVDETALLRNRRLGLACRVLEARRHDPAAVSPYLAVAQRIGLADSEGNILDAEIRSQAEAQLGASSGPASTLSAPVPAGLARTARLSGLTVAGMSS
ncbi:MAG TPA: hypothetical protein VJR29_05720 [bacterium]|nr:hypothetical protein [bacterium]